MPSTIRLAPLLLCVPLFGGCGAEISPEEAASEGPFSTTAQAVTSPPGAWDVLSSKVSSGSSFSCARESNGHLACWGENYFGQLATGTVGGRSLYAKRAATPAAITSVGAGSTHACAIRNDGIVQCWGQNYGGSVGAPSGGSYPTPYTVSGIIGATQMGQLGYHHGCALAAGAVRCWGLGTSGQLGNGQTTNQYIPVTVSLSGVSIVAEGYDRSCALSGGELYCWGTGLSPQGDVTTSTPFYFGMPESIVSSATGYNFGCAVGASGAVYCWGTNDHGQLALPEVGGGWIGAYTVPGVTGAVEVTCGHHHACARLSNGTVKCWGGDEYGQLGNGTVTTYLPPVQVSNLSGATSVSAGYHGTCATAAPGVVYCWGRNDLGQAGDGTTVSPRTTPRRVQFDAVNGP